MAAFVVVGLGYGDEGKGTIVDHLARSCGGGALVVRFNGGPQAGHNVVAPDGTWHCFAQFGAGMLVEGTRSASTADVLVELEALRREGEVLASRGVRDPFARITLDPDATLITPFQKMLGQMSEIARSKGTCGMGVGRTVALREQGLYLRVADVLRPAALRAGLRALKRHAEDEARRLLAEHDIGEMREVHARFAARGDVEALAATYEQVLPALGRVRPRAGTVIFEGAQGALLDRVHGFRPYVTPSRTTAHAALSLVPEARVIGVLRPYAHRHGAGPLVTEDPALDLPDPYNPWNRWQGAFRVGWLDAVALRYAISLQPRVDALAVTSLDRVPTVRACTSYRYHGDPALLEGFDHEGPIIHALRPSPHLTDVLQHCTPHDWVADASIEDLTGLPVEIESRGPTAKEKTTRV